MLLRTIAKCIDLAIVFAAAELLPKAGWFVGFMYLLIADGLMDGRSVGKYLTRLRVTLRDGGAHATVRESVLRNSPIAFSYLFWNMPFVGWAVFGLVLAVEYVVLLGSGGRARIGDEMARTIVIEEAPGPVKREEENV